MPKRSRSIPYRGAHGEGASGTTTVAPSDSFFHRSLIYSAASPRSERKNGSSPRLHGREDGTS
jgi:hypothetical protein